jgi:CheY-like chemotaxis protein
MDTGDRVNILLVDDQPAKLMSYEVILHDLGENLIKATSGREALEYLLKTEVAIVLVDVCMPDLDGFQLAAMIRDHPRFQKTAIIFISAVLLSDMDRLRGYEMGAVDYVPVPVIPSGSMPSSRTASASAPRSSAPRRRGSPRASSDAASRCWRARWARGTGTGSTATACGTRASTESSASIPRPSR